MSSGPYPKRLIEVDLPIREISAHARREKSIRHGHISTLHLWWARRPLASCRAIICASLWPDPVDELCPPSFREAAAIALCAFADKVRTDKHTMELSASHWPRWKRIDSSSFSTDDAATRGDLRDTLLDFIANFANWDASANENFLLTARRLTEAAHAALGGEAGARTRPLVFDPFAGGGAIPLEALRVGADAFASDLNPVAVLLNRVLLEFIPRFGASLADEVRRWGAVVQDRASRELGALYEDDDPAVGTEAYLHARTIRCEGPGCGINVPLVRSLVVAKRGSRSVFLRPEKWKDTIAFSVHEGAGEKAGTVRKGSVACPDCGYTTPVSAVRKQLSKRAGGTKDAQLIAVVGSRNGEQGRFYRPPTPADHRRLLRATELLADVGRLPKVEFNPIPDEEIPIDEPRRINVHKYGMRRWGDLLTDRQVLSMLTACRLINEATQDLPPDRAIALQTCLSLALGRLADANSAQATWSNNGEFVRTTFGRQAIPFVWDFAEANPWGDSGGNWSGAIEWVAKVIQELAGARLGTGRATQASATRHPLPDDAADALVTDPPYYYSVPYSHLSDFFYIWHKRVLGSVYPELFSTPLTPKTEECVQSLPHSEVAHLQKTRIFYEDSMRQALTEARRVTRPEGIATIVFAHTETEAWEALLGALIGAGWLVTASWPIDTERASRTVAQRQRTLGSSIHLVCRPRETKTIGSDDDVGSWRDVLAELPQRIHEWMPRLATEGVVGADAIFACIGPALEVFSRYSRVEKASGEVVALKECLEQIWAAVSKEALSMIFEGADASGLEEDARLTAMWLWTLSTGAAVTDSVPESEEADDSPTAEGDGDDDGKALTGFVLEFDAARKIAQGLGAHLEQLADVVEVKGKQARLLPVSERAKRLFARDERADRSVGPHAKDSKKQLGLFAEMEAVQREAFLGDAARPTVGETTLDRVHQAMILFGMGRSEALRRFVVEDGVGKDERFWKLADSLSKLYPPSASEKRWVDGVLARKKSLGF